MPCILHLCISLLGPSGRPADFRSHRRSSSIGSIPHAMRLMSFRLLALFGCPKKNHSGLLKGIYPRFGELLTSDFYSIQFCPLSSFWPVPLQSFSSFSTPSPTTYPSSLFLSDPSSPLGP